MREKASSEFESLRNSLIGDALNTYRLMNRTLELGFYRTAILCSRHVLDLAGLSQAATITDPPIYFNHIRFGSYFRDNVIPTALEHQVDPMLIFSLIRQESLFDSSITSVASAKGLMQITPDTAVGIVENYGWPPNFRLEDLNRAYINIRLGTHYFKRGLDLYNGDTYAALASYNAGDTATTRWKELSGGDQDLFMEIISYSETRDYIKSIVENHAIYEQIYKR
jgi:soluble lytic murein transglycosylase